MQRLQAVDGALRAGSEQLQPCLVQATAGPGSDACQARANLSSSSLLGFPMTDCSCMRRMQAAPLLSSRAAVTNGWRSLPPADAKLGKLLGHAHGDMMPAADDACVVEALGVLSPPCRLRRHTMMQVAPASKVPVPCIAQLVAVQSKVCASMSA